jgi:phosphatidate cytidylyltransferase
MADETAPPRKSDLVPRLASAAVGLPLLGLAIWVGGYALAAIAAIAALIACFEIMSLLKLAGWRPLNHEGMAWGAAVAGAAALGGIAVLLALAAGGALAVITAIAIKRRAEWVGDWLFTLIGVSYVSLPLATAVLLRDGTGGLAWLLLVFLATFATDTGAYAVGRTVGRHRMAPSLSPSKTWEGAAGGLVAGMAATVALVALLDDLPTVWWAASVLGLAIGSISQVGDLAESKLKRMARVKNSGKLIPGHGGLLDRLDSLVLVFPLVYVASRVWP